MDAGIVTAIVTAVLCVFMFMAVLDVAYDRGAPHWLARVLSIVSLVVTAWACFSLVRFLGIIT